MQAASWGTPDKILRGLEQRRKIVGDFELNVAFRFGGTPYEVAERGLRLFAEGSAAGSQIAILRSPVPRGGGVSGAAHVGATTERCLLGDKPAVDDQLGAGDERGFVRG